MIWYGEYPSYEPEQWSKVLDSDLCSQSSQIGYISSRTSNEKDGSLDRWSNRETYIDTEKHKDK